MAGQIIRRGDKTWLIRIFIGRDATGRRQYFNKTIHGAKKEAEKYLIAKQREKDLGVFVEPASVSLNDFLDKWLQTVARPRLRERTYQDYEWKLNAYVRPALGRKKLCDLRAQDVQHLYGEMSAKGLSPRTVRYAHSILSSALKQAVRWHMLSLNPCDAAELPRMARTEMKALSPEEAKRFLDQCAVDEQGIIFAFALATGMRPEEYLGLKWSDLDLGKGVATVRRTLVWRKGGGWYFGEPKTTRSRRTVPLPTSLVRSLVQHRRAQGERRLKIGGNYLNHELVFATGEGNALNLRNLTQRHFRPILKAAGVSETLRVYDLRHSCATLLLGAGENPKVVSERLGHASIVLTLDTYSHVLPSMQQAATEKLEGLLYPRAGTA